MPNTALSHLTPSAIQLEVFNKSKLTRITRESPHLLIIDDQRFSLDLLKTALAHQYTLHTALNAREGFDRYIDHAPDITCIDIQMPEINGHELAAAINALDPDAYIVMITASSYTDEGSRAIRNHVQDFITKPYSKQRIRTCIEKFMTTHPHRRNIHTQNKAS